MGIDPRKTRETDPQPIRPSLLFVLLFYVLAKPMVISGRVSTCNCVHSGQLYSAALLENQAADIQLNYIILTPSQLVLTLL